MMQIVEKELEEIQASIHGLAADVDLVKKGRRFMMKEELIRLKKSGQAKHPYCVYLFNDMILITERTSKKSEKFKYVDHMSMKDIFFIDCTDSKEKYAFGIMHKVEKKKFKFGAKDGFRRSTWKQTLEKQIEKYCPTDTTFGGGESVVLGSPRNSWSSTEFLGSSLSSHSELESGDDRSTTGDSPPNNPLLAKDDWSSAGSGDEGSTYTEDSDETRSDGDEAEFESKVVERDNLQFFSHSNLNTTLWWLVNYGDKDPILIRTFLHSCMGFTNAQQLFDNMMQIYNLETPVPKAITQRYSLCDTRKRVTFFMKLWVEFFFDRDFYRNKPMFSLLLDFFGDLQKHGLQAEVNMLKLIILRVNKKKLAAAGMNRFSQLTPNQPLHASPALKLSSKSSHHHHLSPISAPAAETKLLDWNITAVAEQFVLIEFALFKSVELKEIANQAWKSENPRKTALNVVNIFNRFELVSQWAATEVVMAQNPKQRVVIIEKLIALAQKCLELRNYNSLMEIIAGLNRGSVQRMKKTWEVVAHTSRETFRSLNSVVDSLQNYKNYRDLLRRSVLPCLPYFGIFLRDLTFTDVGNAGKIGDNINFEKIYLTSRTLKEIQNFQRTPYSFEDDEPLQPLLRRLLAMPEEMLYKHSQTIEPSLLSVSCY